MNNAFIITVHSFPEQFKEIVRLLDARNHYFFVNVDRKSDIEQFVIPNVRFMQMNVNWGGYRR